MVFSAEDPAGGGTLDAAHDGGSFNASTVWGHNWSGINPNFVLGARATARAKLCTDDSDPSAPLITVAGPSPIPAGSVGEPVIEGQELVNLYGATGMSFYWQYPNTGYPFTVGDLLDHGDIR